MPFSVRSSVRLSFLFSSSGAESCYSIVVFSLLRRNFYAKILFFCQHTCRTNRRPRTLKFNQRARKCGERSEGIGVSVCANESMGKKRSILLLCTVSVSYPNRLNAFECGAERAKTKLLQRSLSSHLIKWLDSFCCCSNYFLSLASVSNVVCHFPVLCRSAGVRRHPFGRHHWNNILTFIWIVNR